MENIGQRTHAETGYDRLLRRICGYAAEANSVLVFPSEAVAASWRRAIVEAGADVLRLRQVLAWEQFTRLILAGTRQPVDETARTLFVSNLLAHPYRQRTGQPLFRVLVPPPTSLEAGVEPDSDDSAIFAGYLREILPSLAALLGSPAAARLSPDWRADLMVLKQRYGNFLDTHRLYEPYWAAFDPETGVSADSGGQHYRIFFSEVIPGFHYFAGKLALLANLDLEGLDAEDRTENRAERAHLHCFEQSSDELSWVMARVEKLLDSGVAPQDIALIVPDLEHWEDWLRSYSERWSLPLVFRFGKPLRRYAAGNFFGAIQRLQSSKYDLRALVELLLDPAIPWLQRENAQALIRRALDWGMLRESPRMNLWDRLLYGADEAVGTLFRTLRASVQLICDAPDFAQLQAALERLFSSQMDSDKFAPSEQPVLRVALERLAELRHYSDRLGMQCPNPFALFLGILNLSNYTPPRVGGGIEVYRYNSAAGIAKQHLFILNSTLSATRSIVRPFAFLPEELGADRQDERDMSAALIELYAACNRTVCFSYSRSVFGTPALAATYFLSGGDIIEPMQANIDDHNAHDAEIAFWTGQSEQPPARIYPYQLQGLGNMATISPKARDYTRQPISDRAVLARLLATLQADRTSVGKNETGKNEASTNEARANGVDRDKTDNHSADSDRAGSGYIRLSTTSLEQYDYCHWGFLLGRCLRIATGANDMDPEPPLRIGTIYHTALKQLYDWIAEQGTLSGARLPEYLQHARTICDSLRLGTLSPPAAAAVRLRLGEIVQFVVQNDLERFDGFRVVGSEINYRQEIAARRVVLVGTIDRLLQDPKSAALAVGEYKKRSLPSKRELIGSEQNEALTKPQMIFYMLLLGEQPIAAAHYYSLEGRKAQAVFDHSGTDRAWLNTEQRDDLRAQLHALIDRRVGELYAGDFRPPDPFRGCQNCVHRGICRLKFHFG